MLENKEFNERICKYFYWDYEKEHTFEDIRNGIIKGVSGLENGSYSVNILIENKNKTYKLEISHNRDCCESFELVEFHGSIDLNTRLVDIKIVSQNGESEDGSATWTFVIIETPTSSCTLRFLGESNGYYSEDVDFGIREIENE